MHEVKIVYCVPCGHIQRAEAMKKELEKHGASVTLQGGADGIYDVYIDDKLVFSRHAEKRFPETEEIVAKINELKSSKI
ncbi:MAG: SelT/SelW/SelH family protein [Candidatus Aenigmarchaeota archaeon]|nr:SelT/SelW/SelH family protein [Candidatus Aenigmarchaeota archaeon]